MGTNKITYEDVKGYCKPRCLTIIDNELLYELTHPKIKALEREPKTGHWITEDMFDGDVAYRCSECNELFWIESGTPKDNEYNFCPKCGAKMIEKENDE